VLEHHALGNERAPGQERHDVHDHRIGGDDDPHGLPKRVVGVAAQVHLCAARYCTSASSCAAFSIVPNVLGMMPASFSQPFAIDDVGSRTFLRIDSAVRREPTWVKSGAITCPWPSSLWHTRQPAAWMIAWGSVLPPASPGPAGPGPTARATPAPAAGKAGALPALVPPCG